MDLDELEILGKKAHAFYACGRNGPNCELCDAHQKINDAFPEILRQLRDVTRFQEQIIECNNELLAAREKIRAGEELVKALKQTEMSLPMCNDWSGEAEVEEYGSKCFAAGMGLDFTKVKEAMLEYESATKSEVLK